MRCTLARYSLCHYAVFIKTIEGCKEKLNKRNIAQGCTFLILFWFNFHCFCATTHSVFRITVQTLKMHQDFAKKHLSPFITWIIEEGCRRSFLYDSTLVHEDNSIGYTFGETHFMCNHNHSHSFSC